MHEQRNVFDDFIRPLLGYVAGLGVVLFKHILDVLRDRKAKESERKHKRAKSHGHGK